MKLILASIAGLLIVLLLAMLHTRPARERVLRLAQQELEARQNIELGADTIDYNLLALSAQLTNVSLRVKAAGNPPPFLQADSIAVNFDITRLPFGAITIKEAAARGLELHIVQGPGEETNLPSGEKEEQPEEEETEGPGLQFIVEQLRIPGASVRYENRGQEAVLELPAWDLSIDGDADSLVHRLRFETTRAGSLDIAGAGAPLNHVRLAVNLDPQGAAIDEALVETGGSRVEVSGNVTNWDDLALGLSAQISVDLEEAGRLADLDPLPSGSLNASVKVSGRADSPQVETSLSGDGLQWRSIRNVQLAAELGWDSGSEQLTVNGLDIQSNAGSITADARLALAEQGGESRLNARLRSIDLAALGRELDWPVLIASRLNSSVDANWPGVEWKSASGKANGSLVATIEEPAADRLPVTGRFSASGSAGDLALNISELSTLGSRWSGSVSLAEFERLGGALEAGIDTAVLNPQLAAFLGGERDWPETAGTVQLSVALDGTLEQPAVTTRLSAPNLEVGELDGVNVALNGLYTPDAFTLDDLSVAWRGQELTASGSAGLSESNPNLALEASLDSWNIESVLAGLEIDIPASGAFSAEASISGTRAAPAAALSLNAENLAAYGEEFGRFTAAARYQGGIAELESARLDTPDGGRLDVSGRYDTDAKTYQADLRGDNVKLDTLTLPGETPFSGTLSLSASGSGSVDEPRLEVKLDAEELSLAGRAVGALSLESSLDGDTNTAQFRAPGLAVRAAATTRLNDPYDTEFTFEARNTDISALAIEGPRGKPIAGRITAAVEGAAPLSDFLAGRINATVEKLSLETAGSELHTASPLRARLENRVLHLDSVSLATGESTVSASGSLPIKDPSGDREVRVTGDLKIADILAFADTPEDLDLSGEIQLGGSIAGSLNEPLPKLEVSLTGGNLNHASLNEPLSDIEAALAYDAGLLRVEDFRATLGSASLEASGVAPLSEDQRGEPARIEARLNEFSLGSLADVPEQLTGTVSLRVSAETPDLAHLESLRAEAVFEKLQVAASGLNLEQPEPSRIQVRSGIATIENLALAGPETDFSVTGQASLLEDGEINVSLDGALDAAIVSLFAEDIQAAGPVRLELSATGKTRSPDVAGFLELKEGQIAAAGQDVTAENLDVRLDFTPEMLTISRFSGMLNGGPMSASGQIPLKEERREDLRLGLALRNGFFNIPDGLQTQVWATLMLQPADDEFELGGKIKILDGSYREPLEIQGQFIDFLSRPSFEMPPERSELLEKLNFNIEVETHNPVVVDNNLMELSLESDLRITGNYYQPGMTGRLTLQEGGKLHLNERRYFIERGVVTFVNERSIEPDLDILARTDAANYEITLRLSGGADDYSATFTSDPPLPEPDIISVLLTGRTLDQSRGAELNIATEQALSYVSGRAASRISRAAEKGLGFTSVRIQPELVARDSDPGARLTVGQDITNDLRFVYSMNLVDPADQIQILEYDFFKGFLGRGTRQDDNTVRFDVEHGLQWGGPPLEEEDTAAAQKDLRIGEIRLMGDPALPESEIRGKLKLESGDEYSFFESQNRIEKLRDYYRKQDYLEATVRARREIQAETVDIEVEIAAGPRVEFVFEGFDAPGELRKRVRRLWQDGFIESQRLRESREAVEVRLFRENYLKPSIEIDVSEPSPDRKRVLFDVDAGIKYGDVEIVFPGAEAIDEDELLALVNEVDRRDKLRDEPGEITKMLEEYYRQQGFLAAEVAEPEFEYDDANRSARIVVAVKEGAAFNVGEIAFEGNEGFNRERLLETAFLKSGAEYSKEWMDTWLSRLEELYWTNGYNDLQIEYALTERDDATVDLNFRFQEGRQGVVETVDVDGAYNTSEKLARGQVKLSSGDVLNYRETIDSRRDLYQLGAYSLVDLEPQRLTPDEMTGKLPIRLRVSLRERKPFSVRYGLSYDSERGPGFITDLALRNKLGAARVLGGRIRYDSEFREARGFFTQPVLFGRQLDTTVSGYGSREIRETFITDRTGFSVVQQIRRWRSNVFSYGYRFERTDTFDKDPDSIFQVLPFNVAPLQFSWNRETRDEYLNATRGSFMSGGFEWAPSYLGSDVQFVKYLGQYFKYFPLSDPVEVPFGGPPRSRWVYAVGVRAGLGKGLGGQDLINTERFFAGGSTTLRGFEKDAVGPQDFFGPTGGDATFITNNEIRFPIYRWLEGVGFLDMGNVYRSVSDFNPTDLRYSSGAGVRIRTPFVLIRFDYGFILDRKPGEPVGGFHFSIGQAF